MTALELQKTLAAMPSRAAQALMFSCVEGRTHAECAALYGVPLAEWEILFFEAARALAGQAELLPDAARRALAPRLVRALSAGDPELTALVAPLQALTEQREEVQTLILEAERAAANSPARRREGWLRRLAVVAIIAVSILVWLRDRERPTEHPTGRERAGPKSP